MRRRAKHAKTKAGAKRPRVGKAPKARGSGDRGLEKRLAEALDEQTATREILEIIGRSRSDVQPVFEAIVDSAVRLCGADVGNVTRSDGEWVHMAAMHADAAGIDRLRKLFPARPSGALASLRSISDRSTGRRRGSRRGSRRHLASDASNYVTGQELILDDGGLT
jgi:hypothetical protein